MGQFLKEEKAKGEQAKELFEYAFDMESWEWACVISLDGSFDVSDAEYWVRHWLTELAERKRLRISYVGIPDFANNLAIVLVLNKQQRQDPS